MKPALHVTETRKKKQKCTGIPYKTPVWPISTYKSCRKFDRHQRCKRNVHVHYITDQILTKIESFLSLYGLICGFQQRRNGQYRCYGQYQEPLTPCYMLQSILPSLKLELSKRIVKFYYYNPLSTNTLTPRVSKWRPLWGSTKIMMAFQPSSLALNCLHYTSAESPCT